MIPEKMEKAMNAQVNAEMFSAYLYLAMAAYFESLALKGAANWMNVQAQEEMVHAMKFYNHIVERGGRVELMKIDSPQKEWESPLKAFEEAYKHEQKITGMINDLVNLAGELKDHAANPMLLWFVEEQIEEEANADENVQKLKMAKDNASALYMIDKEFAARIPLFTIPASEA